jgi:hypothetical protein
MQCCFNYSLRFRHSYLVYFCNSQVVNRRQIIYPPIDRNSQYSTRLKQTTMSKSFQHSQTRRAKVSNKLDNRNLNLSFDSIFGSTNFKGSKRKANMNAFVAILRNNNSLKASTETAHLIVQPNLRAHFISAKLRWLRTHNQEH